MLEGGLGFGVVTVLIERVCGGCNGNLAALTFLELILRV